MFVIWIGGCLDCCIRLILMFGGFVCFVRFVSFVNFDCLVSFIACTFCLWFALCVIN